MQVYREISVVDSVFRDRDRSFYNRQTDNGSERPSSSLAGSVYYYKPSKYTNNRFIVWRTSGHKLELIETSLDCTLRGNSISFFFDSYAVPNVIFQEIASPQGMQLHVIVVTGARRVFRFSFPHPSVLSKSSDLPNSAAFSSAEIYTDSIFNVGVPRSETAEPGILLTKIAPGAHVELVVPITHYADGVPADNRYFAAGCSDGAVVIVDMYSSAPSSDRATEIELRESTWWNSLTKVVGAGQRSNRVRGIGSVSFHGHTFIFVLTEDNKLRVFNLPSKACVLTYDFNTQYWDMVVEKEEFVSRALKVIVDDSSPSNQSEPVQKFTLIAYFGTQAGQSHFIAFAGEINSGLKVALQNSGVYLHENGRLVDFDLSQSGVWALWQSMTPGANLSLQYSQSSWNSSPSGFEVSTWEDCVLETVDKSDLSSSSGALTASTCQKSRDLLRAYDQTGLDYSELFADYIFEAGRFSTSVLRDTLESFLTRYTRQGEEHTSPASQEDRSSLKEAFLSAVKSRAFAESSNVTGATDDPNAREQALRVFVYQAWNQILEHCIAAWTFEQVPVGIATNKHPSPSNNGIILVKRGAISVMRLCEHVESMFYLSQTLADNANTAPIRSARTEQCRQLILSVYGPRHDALAQEVAHLLEAMNFVASELSSSAAEGSLASGEPQFAEFDDLIFTSATITDPFSIAVELVQKFLFAQDFVSPSELQRQRKGLFLQTLSKKLSAVRHFVDTTKFLLARLDDHIAPLPPSEASFTAPTQSVYQDLTAYWLAGDLFEHIVTTSIKQILFSRYTLLRNLMFLLAALPGIVREPATSIKSSARFDAPAAGSSEDGLYHLSPEALKHLSTDLIPTVSSRLIDYFALCWAGTKMTFGDPLDSTEADLAALATLTLKETAPQAAAKTSAAGPANSTLLTLKMDDNRGALDGLTRRAAAGAVNRFMRHTRKRNVEDTVLSTYLTFVLGSLPNIMANSVHLQSKHRFLAAPSFIQLVSSTLATILDPVVALSASKTTSSNVALLLLSSKNILDSKLMVSAQLSLPFCLWQKKQFETLQEYLRLQKKGSLGKTEGLIGENNAWAAQILHTFLVGECYIHGGQFDKALSAFTTVGQLIEQAQQIASLGSHPSFQQLPQQLHHMVHVISQHLSELASHTLADENTTFSWIQTVASRRYWRAIIQRLEELQVPDLIIQISSVALSEPSAQAETKSSEAMDVDSKAADQREAEQRAQVEWKSYLWATVFKHAILLGDYQQAYLATINNPVAERSEDCLRRLVIVMAENEALEELISFPYVNLTDQVYDVLLTKARRSDISEFAHGPNFYEILFSFLVAKSNYRQAAATMYELAERLATESIGGSQTEPQSGPSRYQHQQLQHQPNGRLIALEKRCQSLLATINSLKMVDSAQAWLITKRRKYGHPLSPKRKFGDDTPVVVPDATKVDVEVLKLSDIAKQYQAAATNLRAFRRGNTAVPTLKAK